MPISVINAVNLSLLSLTFVLSYLSYASQSRDTISKTVGEVADVEYSARSKLRVSLYAYRFRLLDARSRTTLLFEEHEWGSDTPWAGRPEAFLAGTGVFESDAGSTAQNRERRRRAAEVIIQYAVEEFADGFDDGRDTDYWEDLILDVDLTSEGLLVVCRGREPVDVRRVSDAILQSLRAYASRQVGEE